MTTIAHARLTLIRHGESEANAANRFTGWADPALTAIGRDQAAVVAHRLLEADIRPARVYQSLLGRCAETTRIITSVMNAADVPVTSDAALNERDYGGLTGLNKAEAAAQFGEAQVRQWRRSYAVAPPEGESLRDTAARVLAYHVRTMLPAIMQGGTTLIVSHGNTLRALAMAIDGLDAAQIESFDLSTGATILYTLDSTTAVIDRAVLN